MNKLDRDLLECLVLHVRYLALEQVVRGWFSEHRDGSRRARRHLQRLGDNQLVQMCDVLSRPIAQLKLPLANWQHTHPTPDFESLSRYLRRRARTRAVSTTVAAATTRTRALWGLPITKPHIKLTQTTHDLHVAEIFLHHRRQRAGDGQWISEDRLPQTWPLRQRPDALLLDHAGYFLKAVEYGGDYSSERLRALHRALAALPLAYEIW